MADGRKGIKGLTAEIKIEHNLDVLNELLDKAKQQTLELGKTLDEIQNYEIQCAGEMVQKGE